MSVYDDYLAFLVTIWRIFVADALYLVHSVFRSACCITTICSGQIRETLRLSSAGC